MSNTATQTKSKRRLWWIPVGIAAVLALILVPLFNGSAIDPSAGNGDIAGAAEQADDNDQDGNILTINDAESCPPEFVQKEVGHENERVDDGFAKLVGDNTAEAVKNGASIPEADRDTILEATGYSAHNLAIVATAFGLYAGENVLGPLVTADGKCLSERGQEIHDDLRVALSLTGTDVSRDLVPEHWYNSGIGADGQFGYADQPGFYGDREAIKVTLPNGNVVYIPIRCLNIPSPGKPKHLPTVKTDNPEPPRETTPPEEPPVDNSKSSDRADYQYAGRDTTTDAGIGDKPLVQAGTGPTGPAPVETQHVAPTVRETVTSVTDPVGAETGTPAEDADADTLPPGETEAPANEGGQDSTSTDSGGFD